MGWETGERNMVFYANEGRIEGKDHIWVKDALIATVTMFRRVVLETNMEKIKTLVCTTGYIWGEWSYGEYKRQATGEWAAFKERK